MVRNIESGPPGLVIAAPQVLSLQSIAPMELQIETAIQKKPESIALEMHDVSSMDSTALNWLLAMQQQLAGLGIVLLIYRPNALVTDILLATRLDHRLKISTPDADADTAMGARHG